MNDIHISAAIKRREEFAISHVINKYSRLLWPIVSAILSKVGTVQDVEECVADTFIYLWQNPEKFDPNRGRLKTWLCIVARSKATDRYRRLSKHIEFPLNELQTDVLPDVSEQVLRTEQNHALNDALDLLPEDEREVLIRRYYCGQKPKDISLAMGLSVKQVNNYLYRAKHRLRSELDK